jgi:hypothetical protein
MKNIISVSIALLIGLICSVVLAEEEKLTSKEPAYKSMNSNVPAAKLKSEDLKVKPAEKLISKEPAKSNTSSAPTNTVKSTQKEAVPTGMNSNKPSTGINSEDLKKKTPDNLSRKEPANQ